MTNILHEIDCNEYMKDIPDNHFDLAVVDPPYGIGAGEMKMNNSNHKYKKWDNNKPDKYYFNDLLRISKNQIIWGGNYFDLPQNKCFIIWDKKQPEGVSFAMAEYAWTSLKSVAKVFYQFPSHVTQGKKIHPTQKPIALYKWLLTNYAKPGYKLFDSHSGSGSFRIAAYDMGFDLVSCELDPDYCRDNEARFQRHIQQQELFTPEEIQEKIYQEQELEWKK